MPFFVDPDYANTLAEAQRLAEQRAHAAGRSIAVEDDNGNVVGHAFIREGKPVWEPVPQAEVIHGGGVQWIGAPRPADAGDIEARIEKALRAYEDPVPPVSYSFGYCEGRVTWFRLNMDDSTPPGVNLGEMERAVVKHLRSSQPPSGS